MVRLGKGDRITADLTKPVLFYAVGQASLTVEVREGDSEALEYCKTLNHWPSEWRGKAERAMLRMLEGGCSVPVGTYTSLETPGGFTSIPTKSTLTIIGTVTSLDGSQHVEQSITETISSGSEAEAVGEKVAKLLMENGAKPILDDVSKDREAKGVKKD